MEIDYKKFENVLLLYTGAGRLLFNPWIRVYERAGTSLFLTRNDLK